MVAPQEPDPSEIDVPFVLARTTGEDGLDEGVLLLEEARLAEARGDRPSSHLLFERSAAILSLWLPPKHPDRLDAVARADR